MLMADESIYALDLWFWKRPYVRSFSSRATGLFRDNRRQGAARGVRVAAGSFLARATLIR